LNLELAYLLTFSALVGHVAITVWLFNRLHALGWPRPVVKTLEKLLLLTAIVVLAFLCAGRALPTFLASLVFAYSILCSLAALATIPLWLIPKLLEKTPAALLSNDTALIDVEKRLGFRPIHGPEASLLAAIPGNELLKIAVQKKTLHLPNLPPSLDGLTIAHLTDLHMTGQLGREYYETIVDETNALEADLIVITGDILEREHCLPWIAPTLGRLKARHGKFFILGNHEQRLHNTAPLRSALTTVGLTDLGSKCELLAIHGTQILIAGTERPWFGCDPEIPHFAICNLQSSATPHSALRAPQLPDAGPSPHPPAPSFRLLLSHTPDQLPFARRHHFDLMLAGHNHGGQIRLPYLGALITPSFYGSRYSGGLYDAAPTLLHVSRGLAGIHPIRLNCPPELPLLILKAK
jgi:predicted MPP superfamily phosphohydrolase